MRVKPKIYLVPAQMLECVVVQVFGRTKVYATKNVSKLVNKIWMERQTNYVLYFEHNNMTKVTNLLFTVVKLRQHNTFFLDLLIMYKKLSDFTSNEELQF